MEKKLKISNFFLSQKESHFQQFLCLKTAQEKILHRKVAQKIFRNYT